MVDLLAKHACPILTVFPMAYSDYTAKQLTALFQVRFEAANLFEGKAQPVVPSAWLLESLQKGQNMGFTTEKARSERLVTPILIELADRNAHSFTVYSGMEMNVDEELGLRGECDFILSHSSVQDFITAPMFHIVEAKKQDVERGTMQCAAQLIAAQRLNQREGFSALQTLYGCATTGIEWRFLRLQSGLITIDRQRYFLNQPDHLLGVLQWIVEATRLPAQPLS